MSATNAALSGGPYDACEPADMYKHRLCQVSMQVVPSAKAAIQAVQMLPIMSKGSLEMQVGCLLVLTELPMWSTSSRQHACQAT